MQRAGPAESEGFSLLRGRGSRGLVLLVGARLAVAVVGGVDGSGGTHRSGSGSLSLPLELFSFSSFAAVLPVVVPQVPRELGHVVRHVVDASASSPSPSRRFPFTPLQAPSRRKGLGT